MVTDDKNAGTSMIQNFRSGQAIKNVPNVIVGYVILLVVGAIVYNILGGSLQNTDAMDRLYYISSFMEGLGLLVLRQKIHDAQSVNGISGMTVLMYGYAYILRASMMPKFTWKHIDVWCFEMLDIYSLVMVLNILWCIFKTYRDTWRQDLDTLLVRYLIPVCIVLTLCLHPDLRRGSVYNYTWTACMYLDNVALMPQVVMMSKMGDVEAPIAHFVAATAFSRALDIVYWVYAFNMVGPRDGSFNFSGWLIMTIHFVGAFLLADFMYFYVKAMRSRRRKSGEALQLPTDGLYDVC